MSEQIPSGNAFPFAALTDRAAVKKSLRQAMQAKRRALSLSERRQAGLSLYNHGLPRLRHLRCIAFFLAVNGEANVQALMKACARLGIKIVLPRLDKTGKSMSFREYYPGDKLQKNRYGIPEPVRHRRMRLNEIDLILLPLTAFDDHGQRLGMGGGYYDKLLAGRARSVLRRPLRIGVGYHWQEHTTIPAEPWDIRLHGILSDQAWLKF